MSATKIEFIPASSVNGHDVRSKYTQDGSYARDLPAVRTVGELIDLLQQIPRDLPLYEAKELTWFNVGMESECLDVDFDDEADMDLDEDDDWDDEEDDVE